MYDIIQTGHFRVSGLVNRQGEKQCQEPRKQTSSSSMLRTGVAHSRERDLWESISCTKEGKRLRCKISVTFWKKWTLILQPYNFGTSARGYRCLPRPSRPTCFKKARPGRGRAFLFFNNFQKFSGDSQERSGRNILENYKKATSQKPLSNIPRRGGRRTMAPDFTTLALG